jgi:Secretion system C-terminal sorting domain
VVVDDTRGLILFPNPVSGGSFTVFGEQPMEWLRVMDGLGRVVYSARPNSTRFVVNLPFLAAGIYYVQAAMASGVKTQKLWFTP